MEVYDRSNPGGSPPEDNFYTDFIKEGMLRDHNVNVEFVPVPRWTEVEVLNNLLAAGDAPDIAVTYSYPTIQTYANMGGVIDLAPYLEKYKDLLPNLWNLLGEQNIYWNRDPETGTVWAIEAVLFQNKRINTFVREDWLKKLGLAEPTTLEEFENMLRAFRDNAEMLLGPEADKMIPVLDQLRRGLAQRASPDVLCSRELHGQGDVHLRLRRPALALPQLQGRGSEAQPVVQRGPDLEGLPALRRRRPDRGQLDEGRLRRRFHAQLGLPLP